MSKISWPNVIKRFTVVIYDWFSNNLLVFFLQSSYDLLTIFSWSPCNLLLILLWFSYHLLTIFLQSSYDLFTIFLQSFYNLLTIFIQFSYSLLTVFLWSYDFLPIHIQKLWVLWCSSLYVKSDRKVILGSFWPKQPHIQYRSGWKPTHLTSFFSLQTSVFTLPHGTTLTAYRCLYTDVRGC